MTTMTLLGLSGSLRKDSTNTQLLQEAARIFGDATYIQADLNLPLYDGDLENRAGLPQAAQTLATQIAQADGVLISSPEYNSGISGVQKNALDWISRSDGSPWLGKPVAVMSAAAGREGGARAQTMLRSCMVPFRPRIAHGPEILVADASAQFDDIGRLNPRYEKSLGALMQALRADIVQTR